MSLKTKLIFNLASGNPTESAVQVVEAFRQLQKERIQTKVLLVQPGHRLPALARNAARAGAKMVIVSGGDGTIKDLDDRQLQVYLLQAGIRRKLWGDVDHHSFSTAFGHRDGVVWHCRTCRLYTDLRRRALSARWNRLCDPRIGLGNSVFRLRLFSGLGALARLVEPAL